jgi:hypothetical protein
MATIYVETTIASFLTARPSRDLVASAKQLVTRQWWDDFRHKHELFLSELVLMEASQGDPLAAGRRLEVLSGIPLLLLEPKATLLARKLVAGGGLPAKAHVDALHVAVATLNGIDILLTWNCKHIANPVTYPLIESICAGEGLRAPVLCTPMELEVSDEPQE